MGAVQSGVLDVIQSKGRGKVHVAKDFLEVGGRAAVDQALGRLAEAGTLRRLARGLYHYPRTNERLGVELGADDEEVAQALARRVGARAVPSGAVAANVLGLSTQMPGTLVYLTDGRSRVVRVGGRTYSFRHVQPKDLPPGGPATLVIQALRHLGADVVDDAAVARLRAGLPPGERQKLLREARYATGWVTEVLRRVAGEVGDG